MTSSSLPGTDATYARTFIVGCHDPGRSGTAAWTSVGFDATEIGLLTEQFWGVPTRTYVRTRAWTDAQLDAAEERLVAKGLMADGAFTEAGRSTREALELATDLQMRPAIEALADDADELFAIIEPWGAAIRQAGGYLMGPDQLTAGR